MKKSEGRGIFCILHSNFELLNSSALTPHPAFGHLLPACGEEELARDPSPREAGRGWREAPGEGRYRRRLFRRRTGAAASPSARLTRWANEFHCRYTSTYLPDECA